MENKNWVKWVVGIIVILLIVGFITLKKPTESEPLKIGILLPLSGNLGFLGEPAKQGAELALEETGLTNKYKLIFEDDQFNPQKTITAANKLISIDKVNVIISFGSSAANVVKPLAEKNKILHFAIASDPKITDGVYNFNHWTPPKEEARALVEELVKRKIKKIGILTANQEGMLAITSEVEKQAEISGISIINNQKFNIGEKDFRTLITKIKENLPEILIMTNYTPELEILGKQIKDAGIKIPMTSIEGFDQTTDQKLFNGYWYASASDPSNEFVSLFKTKFNKEPGFGTGNVYDIIKLIIKANENIDNPTTTKLVSELLKIKNFKGAMGSISINQDGSVLSKATIKTVIAK